MKEGQTVCHLVVNFTSIQAEGQVQSEQLKNKKNKHNYNNTNSCNVQCPESLNDDWHCAVNVLVSASTSYRSFQTYFYEQRT